MHKKNKIMELTINIDTRKKDAKVFLEYIKSLSFISFPEKETKYDKEFVKRIKEAEKEIEKGNTIRINPNNVWESIL